MSGIKKYESSVGLDELVYGLVDSNKHETTLGELWETHVNCIRCPFEIQCTEITEYFETKGENAMCMDVISILVGDKTIEEVTTEIESRNY